MFYSIKNNNKKPLVFACPVYPQKQKAKTRYGGIPQIKLGKDMKENPEKYYELGEWLYNIIQRRIINNAILY